jgi:hypothetical protein
MAVNNIWRVRWMYLRNGRQVGDIQFSDVIDAGIVGGDGTVRPNAANIATVIGNNFSTPTGASISLLGISSAQSAFAYS